MSALLDLVGILSTLESAFATGASLTWPKRAKLQVDGLELLPLHDSTLKQLIKLATPAPYGKADKTLVDPAVRAALQVDASQITESKAWRGLIQGLVEELSEELAVEGEVRAELYKLLIYEEGGHFKPHRDSEKAAGMFGTLIITLPAEFEGGELVVTHAQETKRFKLRARKDDELCWAAFYADCVHELEPVTSGHRVALVYNLISAAMTAPAPVELTQQLATALQRWRQQEQRAPKIVHLLTHKYTERSFGPKQLKGYDAQMTQALAQACELAGFELFVALLNVTEFGAYYGEDEGGGWYDEYEEWDEDEYEEDERQAISHEELPLEDMELSHYDCLIEYWSPYSTKAQPLHSRLTLNQKEFTSFELLSELEPDEKSFEGYTGNEGNSYELRYRVAALVMWPKDSWSTAFSDASIDEKMSLYRTLALAKKTAHPYSPNILEGLLDDILRAAADNSYLYARVLPELLDLLTKFKLQSRLPRPADQLDARAYIDQELISALIKWCGTPQEIEDTITRLTELMQQGKKADKLIELGKHLSKCSPEFSVRWLDAIFPSLKEGDALQRTKRLCDHLKRYEGEALKRLIHHVKSSPDDFDPVTLAEHAGTLLKKNKQLSSLLKHVVQALERLTKQAPEPPSDYVRALNLPSTDLPAYEQIVEFMRAPNHSTVELSIGIAERKKVERALEASGAALKITTLKKGSPYKLVLTKTLADHQRAIKTHQHHLRLLEKLQRP